MTLKPIVDLLTAAGKTLKKPAITLEIAGQPLKLSLAPVTGKNPGHAYITDGVPNGRYFGKINPAGLIIAGRDMSPGVEDALREFAKDPVGQATAHGHKTGRCCFCNLKLKDARSTEVGYGPICATKWGLPWGEKTQKTQAKSSAAQGEGIANPVPTPQAPVAESQGIPFHPFISDYAPEERGVVVAGLKAHYDAEGDLTHWDGQGVTIFND